MAIVRCDVPSRTELTIRDELRTEPVEEAALETAVGLCPVTEASPRRTPANGTRRAGGWPTR